MDVACGKQTLKQKKISFAGSLGGQGFNLDRYVVGKTLDGLFYMLGQEEKQIRENPAAQSTSLLKEVFGKRSLTSF